MTGILFQSTLLFLIGWMVCVDGYAFAKSPTNFPFADKFRSRLLNPDDIGEYLDLNVTLSDYNSRVYDSKDLKSWPGSACYRDCKRDEKPRICYFEWTEEYWNVYGPACGDCQNGDFEDCFTEGCVFADGFERGILTINRQVPGPQIDVCLNDIIVVDVKNHLAGHDDTIHWHGILQKKTPWMDGVPYITQCPIHSDSTFRYAFVVSKTDTGTNYYHSHNGHIKVDGIFGALVARDPNDPNRNEYQCDLREHTIVINDWFHYPSPMMVPGLQNISQIPVTYMLNGRGPYRNPATGQYTKVPLTILRMDCSKCKSHRIRVINADSSVCPVRFQIEQHRLKVIATDSYSIKSIVVDTIFSAAGERFDFVLPCHPPGEKLDYWIVVSASGFCQAANLHTFGLLTYDMQKTDKQFYETVNAYPAPNVYPEGVALNKMNTVCGGQNICPSDLEDAERLMTKEQKRKLIRQLPDKRIILTFNNYRLPNNEEFQYEVYPYTSNIARNKFVGAVNNITFSPPSFSMDTQPKDFTKDTCCDPENLPSLCDGFSQCPCTHCTNIPTGSVVDLYLIDDTQTQIPMAHPWHLHGHNFFVMDQYSATPDQPISHEIVRQAIEDGTFDMRFGQLRRSNVNYDNPARKDTTQIPSKGLSVLRVLFDNPGFWYMHCHIDWHLGIGMALVHRVGKQSEITPPPDTFPKCRDYKPTVILD